MKYGEKISGSNLNKENLTLPHDVHFPELPVCLPARKKVVVTDGAGFIGSHLVEELAPGYEVFIIDDLSSGRMENI